MNNNIINQRAISSLIVITLLVAVTMVVITIVLQFSVDFTETQLETSELISTQIETTSFANVYLVNGKYSYENQALTFTYNPPSNISDKTIIVNKVSVLGYDEEFDVDDFILRNGTNIISNLDLSALNIEGYKVDVVLKTVKNDYLNLKNTKYVQPIVEEIGGDEGGDEPEGEPEVEMNLKNHLIKMEQKNILIL